ncbi:MAG: hypothetical protein DMF75_18935 [Acidobacteria bacterium]|nr:MAG: hypothetical protein DMF75_18935 [Acidobacteriota bacterium]
MPRGPWLTRTSNVFARNKRDFRPCLAIGVVLAFTAWELHRQGRQWWCSCRSFLWTSDAWGSQTSQAFLDPYSFTHILHGLAFCGLLALLIRGMSTSWRLTLAIAIESAWEIIENSNTVIQRYRAATAALGYQGDTVVNSLGDIMCCVIGFAIARRLGWRRTIFVFLATELALIIWIRDSLLLEILMLIHPVNAIKMWQIGG